jgi:GntR family transcriptional repressor for pyruvate dehydrogenase complex
MSLLLVITPDILKNYNALKVCSADANMKIIEEHREIMRCIEMQDVAGVEKAMKEHLSDVTEFSATLTA